MDIFYLINLKEIGMPKKKLSCHCGGVEAKVNVLENGFKKIMRCNCSICKRKGIYNWRCWPR